MTDILLDLYVRSIAFSLLGLIGLWMVRRQSASVQHSVAIVSLIVLLGLPLMRFALPELKVPILARAPVFTSHVVAVTPQPISYRPSTSARSAQTQEPTHLNLWILAWTLGFGAVIARYAVGLALLERWVLKGMPAKVQNAKAALVVSNAVAVPMTAWLGRHVVLLPPSWNEWHAAKQNSALQHELAHMQRSDWATQLAAKLACALFWPNPFVWLISKQSRILAERAADDMVLATGIAPTRYAQDLLEIAREAKATTPELSICMAKSPDVARRIEMIINKETRRGAAGVTTLTIAGSVMLALAAPVCCLALTRQTTAPPAKGGISNVAAQGPVVELDTWFLAHGVTLESIGLVKKKGQRQPSFLALSDKAADELISRLKKAKLILDSPKIRTQSDEPATMNMARSWRESETVSITPHVGSGGSIDFTLHSELRTPGDTALRQDMRTSDLSTDIQHSDDILTSDIASRVQAGNTLVIASLDFRERPLEVYALFRLKVLGNLVTPYTTSKSSR